MMSNNNITILGDDTYIKIPENTIQLKTPVMDELENELWNTMQQYLAAFGITLINEDGEPIDSDEANPPYYVIKSMQDYLIQTLEEAGCKFSLGPEQ